MKFSLNYFWFTLNGYYNEILKSHIRKTHLLHRYIYYISKNFGKSWNESKLGENLWKMNSFLVQSRTMETERVRKEYEKKQSDGESVTGPRAGVK